MGNYLYWLLCGISGLLLYSAMALHTWIFAILGLVAWLYVVHHSKTAKMALSIGFAIGLCKALGALSVIWSAYPLESMELSAGWITVLIMGIGWFISAVPFAVGMSVVTVSVWLLKDTSYAYHAFPLLWVAGEVFSSLLFSIIQAGTDSYLNIHFTFGYIGYLVPLLEPMKSVAVFGGVYALSALFFYFSLLSFQLVYDNKSKKQFIYLASLVIGLISAVYIFLPVTEPVNMDTKIITFDTRFSTMDLRTEAGRIQKYSELFGALSEVNEYNPDIILLPEDSRLTYAFSTPETTLDFLKFIFIDNIPLVVDTSRRDVNDESVALRAYYYDLENTQIYSVDKQYLVPHGEYITNVVSFMLNKFQRGDVLNQLMLNQNYVPGPRTSYESFPETLPPMLFCNASIAPLLVKSLSHEQESDIILHVSSHGYFENSLLLNKQLDSMLKINALWTGKTIVQAGNMMSGKTYLSNGTIDYGEVLKETDVLTMTEYSL